jgi:hypothetical protein
MKQPWEWIEEDIEALIRDGVQESLTLDYKRSASLERRNPKRNNDLSKDVTSFANSTGGTLIYGVEEVGHLPKSIDSGFDPTDITREWLEQVINSTIQRRIEGVRIKQIALEKTYPGRVMYVVYIPQSNRAPHMASDHIFYKRFNYQSVPMEEYEVRDVSNRSESPNLDISLTLSNGDPVEIEFEGEKALSEPIKIIGNVKNESPTPAMYYIFKIFIDSRLKVFRTGGIIKTKPQITLAIGDETFSISQYYYNSAVPARMPIWESLVYRIPDDPIEIMVPRIQGIEDYLIYWEIHSPKMLPKTGAYILKVNGETASLLKSPSNR